MPDEEIDTEEVVKFEGQVIYMCCGSCVKAFNANPDYYVKIGTLMNLIPQIKQTEELKKRLDKVELLEQRYCVVRDDAIIHPKSPFVEYKGKKIYFFRSRDIERRWEKNKEQYFK